MLQRKKNWTREELDLFLYHHVINSIFVQNGFQFSKSQNVVLTTEEQDLIDFLLHKAIKIFLAIRFVISAKFIRIEIITILHLKINSWSQLQTLQLVVLPGVAVHNNVMMWHVRSSSNQLCCRLCPLISYQFCTYSLACGNLHHWSTQTRIQKN